MKLRCLLPVLLLAAKLSAQNQAILGEDPVRISDHVWALMGSPNVGIVVGNSATLVVDTGLGRRNGATVVRVARKLGPSDQKLFLTTTHFHPEHASGESAFPPGTILIRNSVQQRDMEQHGMEMVDMFRSRSPLQKELLADVSFRKPDVIFDSEYKLDLGGVTARLFWFGSAHTQGDEVVFIEPDRTLIPGDVVQNKVVPSIVGDGGPPSSWLAVIDKVAALKPLHVLPDHSAPGDGSLVAAEKNFITDLRNRALDFKRKGVSADDAATQISSEFKAKYTDWPSMNVIGFVRSIYAE